MKNIYVLLLLIIVLVSCNTNRKQTDTSQEAIRQTSYDSLLAVELGADKYGMKQYIMAFLMRGDSSSADSAEAAMLQRAHLDNITQMAENGDLILAGPFLDDGDIRGIYIFNVSTVEKARELTSSDPAIKAGVLKMELHPWYGSAILQKLNELHASIQAEGI